MCCVVASLKIRHLYPCRPPLLPLNSRAIRRAPSISPSQWCASSSARSAGERSSRRDRLTRCPSCPRRDRTFGQSATRRARADLSPAAAASSSTLLLVGDGQTLARPPHKGLGGVDALVDRVGDLLDRKTADVAEEQDFAVMRVQPVDR